MVSGILSVILALILWWSVTFSANNESQRLLFRNNNGINIANTTHKMALKEHSEMIKELERKNNNSINTTVSWKWMKNIAAPSLLITALMAAVFLTISLTDTTSPSKYLYITYFKDYNFTITIQVIHNITQ